MSAPRFPPDVRLLEWAGREDFGRLRAGWLELIRWDLKLLPVAKLVIQEIAAKLGHDRSDAWPSIPRLAAALDISEPTVKRAIASAIERGWVVCEKRGFGGSNRYAMATSRAVVNEVSEAYDRRMERFEETRRTSMRSSMISMSEDDSIEITGDPSMRSPMISHSDHPRSLNEITGDPLSLSSIPTTDPLQRSHAERLGATEQDETQCETEFSSESLSPLRPQDDWQAIADARDDLIQILGDGDSDRGTRMFAALGKRATHLAELVAAEGAGATADRILAAKADACRLLREKPPALSEVNP